MWNLRCVAILGTAALASCAPREAPRAPEPEPPRPRLVQAQPVPQPAPPPSSDWQEAPLTPGDWSYSAQGSGSAAMFGAPGRPLFAMRCEPSRQVSLVRPGVAAGQALTVRTSSGSRAVAAAPGQGGLTATLAASDRLLDSIAFSRGRFAIESPGAPMLILPSWPEVARVIEDCRA